jgi:hypothetical protein
MDALIEFSRRGAVAETIAAATRNDIVLGVVIDVDPFWQFAWRLHDIGQPEFAERWLRRGFPPFDLWSLSGIIGLPGMSRGPVDAKWRPPWWHAYLDARYGKYQFDDPFIVKICLSDVAGRAGTARPELPQVGLPVTFEWRTPATLAADPKNSYRPLVGGVSAGCGISDPFTIGGIAFNGTTYYGVTCAHGVKGHSSVDQPSSRDGIGGFVGTVANQYHPLANPAGALCNPWSGTATMNDLDVALIKLGSVAQLEVLDIGSITGIAPRSAVWPRQPVEITGRTSRHKSLEVGGLAAVYRFDDGTDSYCFQNLFELRQPLAGFGTPRACRGGDSGAWVCYPTGASQAEWVGMVIGADALIGYGVFAETIESWWSGQGLGLSVR